MENNLSRVIAAVSHELITSTTRALTVSFLIGLNEIIIIFCNLYGQLVVWSSYGEVLVLELLLTCGAC